METLAERKTDSRESSRPRCSDFDWECAHVLDHARCHKGGIYETPAGTIEIAPADGECPYLTGRPTMIDRDEVLALVAKWREDANEYVSDLALGITSDEVAAIRDCATELEALAAKAEAQGGEVVADVIDSLTHRLEAWDKAYPVDIFSEVTREEHEWLRAEKPGLMDRISAAMGRHIAKCIREDVSKLRNYTHPAPKPAEGEVIERLCRNLRQRADSGESAHGRTWCDGVRFAVNQIECAMLAAAPKPAGVG